MAEKPNPHALEPDAFVQECRNALVEVAASLPAEELPVFVERLQKKRLCSTPDQHANWLQSHQFQAIKLEAQFKQPNQDAASGQ